MSKGGSGSKGGNSMTQSAASRIQAAAAQSNGGQVSKGSFAARAQAAAAKGGNTGGKSGK